MFMLYLKLIRPKHWVKNFIIFATFINLMAYLSITSNYLIYFLLYVFLIIFSLIFIPIKSTINEFKK